MAKRKKGVSKTNKRTNKKKKKRLRFRRILFACLLFALLIFLLSQIFHFPIKNIYVSGNQMFSDQEIIEMAKLSDYPSIFAYSSNKIKKTLEQNTYIEKATIKKKKLKEVYIEIKENRPIFYDKSKEKTILADNQEVDGNLGVPVLINYIPDTIYDKFLEKIVSIDEKIYSKVSEIKYDPNKVDNKRFLLTMNDGNYVYLTLNKFEKLNNYVEIMQKVLTKYKEEKGILYLDEGEYFKKNEWCQPKKVDITVQVCYHVYMNGGKVYGS